MRLHNLVGLVLLAGGALAAVVLVTAGGASAPAAKPEAVASGWRGLVGAPRQRVALGQRVVVLLRAPSLADRVHAAGGTATDTEERRWTAAALASQQQLLVDLANEGILAKPDLRFTHVVNGFSAVVDPAAVAALERDRNVRGVYPVHALYPASLDPPAGVENASALPAAPSAYAGRGITIALLDTGVDPDTPYLNGHVLPGIDIVSGGPDARVTTGPGGRPVESHGTEMAGIVVGAGEPSEPAGIAPQATILPIRVAGWQADASGQVSQYGRTDQLLAGLERAVDPNGDGDAHDAARIALVALVEPFAAFADSPVARAVAGAVDLDTLVVAPAGNDGPAGPSFGSVAGPGGAPAALTVGAADFRPAEFHVPVVVRAGLRVLLREQLPLLSPVRTRKGTLELVGPTAAVSLRSLFDPRGLSVVAGRAVLLPPSPSPQQSMSMAARAGAAVVLLPGRGLPAGGLPADPSETVPVLEAPPTLGAMLTEAKRNGLRVWISVGGTQRTANSDLGRVAAFSSWGLAFGGEVKPDIVAPGVGVATAEPVPGEYVESRFVTVNGSSAAAAVAAGIAARLAEARPSLDAGALRSLLVGTALPIGGAPLAAQGSGTIDLAGAAAGEVATDPATISFGRWSGDGWRGTRELRLRNLSNRPLTVYLAGRRAVKVGVVLRIAPRSLRIQPGAVSLVQLSLRIVGAPRRPAAAGVVHISPIGSRPLRVPWSVVLAPVERTLLGSPTLSPASFTPSDLSPAVLAVRVGRVGTHHGRYRLEPALSLDLELWNGARRLGLLARLRDVLPGRYSFGLTGRGPDGNLLPPGAYALHVVAWPVAGGRPVVKAIRFTIQ